MDAVIGPSIDELKTQRDVAEGALKQLMGPEMTYLLGKIPGDAIWKNNLDKLLVDIKKAAEALQIAEKALQTAKTAL
jgi:hypothetical protein